MKFKQIPIAMITCLLTVQQVYASQRDVPCASTTEHVHQAIVTGNWNVISALIDESSLKANQALLEAARLGNCKITTALLDHGADINTVDEQKQTALHRAVSGRHIDVVRLLLERQANTSLLDDQQATPLFGFVFRGPGASLLYNGMPLILTPEQKAMLKLLVSHASSQDKTATLHHAIKMGYEMIIPLLINAGVDPRTKLQEAETTVLHCAAQHGRESIVSCLINARADVNAKDYQEETPLHIAVKDKEHYGETPLYKVIPHDLAIAQLLIQAGADTTARDKKGKTPLRTILESSATAAQIDSVFQLLLGDNLNAHDTEEDAPLLHYIVLLGFKRIAKLLLACDAYIDEKYLFDEITRPITPLQSVLLEEDDNVSQDNEEMALFLVNHGAEVDPDALKALHASNPRFQLCNNNKVIEELFQEQNNRLQLVDLWFKRLLEQGNLPKDCIGLIKELAVSAFQLNCLRQMERTGTA